MRTKTTLLALLVLLAAVPSHAYVEVLHFRMAGTAYDRATTEGDFMKRYQFDALSHILRDDIQYGAYHEDDFPNSLNHFYDPQADIPLRIQLYPLPICKDAGIPAPDWALGSANQHGLAAAHFDMYNALTAAGQGDRDAGVEDLFQDLGHIIHLIQDMGQPEHTRNDQHLLLGGFGLTGFPIKMAASLYENWTRDNIGLNNILPDNTNVDVMLDEYPSVQAFTNRSYFANSGIGLADFASNNYVTQDTNYKDTSFHCVDHVSPALGLATPRNVDFIVHTLNPDTGLIEQIPVHEKIYSYNPLDYRIGQYELDNYHTIESYFNHETQKYDPNVKVFSLDDPSWMSRAVSLLPKAVGYSAGFIEHFFRGRIYTTWDMQKDHTWKVTMFNYNEYAFSPHCCESLTNCVIETFATDDSGQLKQIAPVTPRIAGCDFFAPAAANIPADPDDPIYKHDIRVVAVGTLGDEEGAVIGEIIPARHEMKLQFDYDPHVPYTTLGVDVRKQGKDPSDCAGCSWSSGFAVNTQPGTGGNLTWATGTPPSGGTATITFAISDTDQYYADVNAFAKNDTTSAKSGTLTLFKDGQQVGQLTVTGTTSLRATAHFDGNGNLTQVP